MQGLYSVYGGKEMATKTTTDYGLMTKNGIVRKIDQFENDELGAGPSVWHGQPMKLRSGDWGIFIPAQSDAGHGQVTYGTSRAQAANVPDVGVEVDVLVTTKSGKSWKSRVRSVAITGKSGGGAICEEIS